MFLKLNITKQISPAAISSWLRNIAVAFFFSAAIQMTPAAGVELLACEGFAYPAGNSLAGQGGGIGWSKVWVDVRGNANEIVGSGPVAGANAPLGFDARSGGNAVFVNTNSRAGRWLDCSSTGNFGLAGFLDGNGKIGANGKTLYLSFVQQHNFATNNFYEFEFHRNNLGDPGRIGGIGCDIANSSQVYLRAPASTSTPLGVSDTNANFYVLRIDYKAGNDDVYVYRNPIGS